MHPSPYRDAVAKRLQDDSRFSLDIYYVFGEDFGHAGMGLGVAAKPLAESMVDLHPKGFVALRLMVRILWIFSLSSKYDLVVWTAYAPWWMTIAVVIRAMLRKKYALATDTTREVCGCVSRTIKRFLFFWAKFFWVPGTASRNFLISEYDVDERKIVEGVYSCDFVPMPKTTQDGVIYLMVANDTDFRRMDVVAEGFRAFVESGGNGRLVLCGNGVGKYKYDGVECMDGGLEWKNLPYLYANSDVYVHNGTEQFSVATLMGAMAGLPLLCSAKVGVIADLFRGGEVGMLVEEWDSVEAWTEAFRDMSARKSDWHKMGDEAYRMTHKFNMNVVADRVGNVIAM